MGPSDAGRAHPSVLRAVQADRSSEHAHPCAFRGNAVPETGTCDRLGVECLDLQPQQTMPLSPGTRLGHYDVTSLLGEGGMGQVWQATDTQLNRQVALKILPDAFARDPDRLARFTREAQILASLNH